MALDSGQMGMTRCLVFIMFALLAACTPEAAPVTHPDTAKTPAEAEIEIPAEYGTVKAQGKHGLEIRVSAPESVFGGRRFNIIYEVSDDEGEMRGVQVEWGDGKVWGGLPMDLVCTGVAGKPNLTEPASREDKKLQHAYRTKGTYTVKVSAYTGGCFVHWDRASTTIEIEVVESTLDSNGPVRPRAKIGHAYYTDGDPSVLVSDIGGYDEDGFVSRIDIDWGDGSTETIDQPLSRCKAPGGGWPGGWFSRPTNHRYEKPGEYLVKIEVISTGCDGELLQKDSAQRTLEFPPEQGS